MGRGSGGGSRGPQPPPNNLALPSFTACTTRNRRNFAMLVFHVHIRLEVVFCLPFLESPPPRKGDRPPPPAGRTPGPAPLSPRTEGSPWVPAKLAAIGAFRGSHIAR